MLANPTAMGVPAVMPGPAVAPPMPMAAPAMAAPMPMAAPMLGQAHPRFAQAAMANPGAIAAAVSKFRNGGTDNTGRVPYVSSRQGWGR